MPLIHFPQPLAESKRAPPAIKDLAATASAFVINVLQQFLI
jgi:hypothetical protein